MTRRRHHRALPVALLLALLVCGLGVTAGFAAEMTSPFAGNTVNGGTVTHETQGGKHVLTLSSDFKVPGSPDPHWQVVDSRGNTYLLNRVTIKDDKVNRSITLPAYVLPRFADDPRKELPFSGVFCPIGGELRLVATDLSGPNGLAFSPDERYLYVGNWDPQKKVVMPYEVWRDGSLGPGHVFFDMTRAPGEDAIDGIKVDRQGHLYVSGPGGLWILSPEGKHLGTLKGPEHPHNLAWGDDDGRTLYLTAQTGLYRIRVQIPGVR